MLKPHNSHAPYQPFDLLPAIRQNSFSDFRRLMCYNVFRSNFDLSRKTAAKAAVFYLECRSLPPLFVWSADTWLTLSEAEALSLFCPRRPGVASFDLALRKQNANPFHSYVNH